MQSTPANPWGDSPAKAWLAAAADPIVASEFELILDELARATNARRPICHASGRCCKFEEFGHRLYVTGFETAWLIRQLPPDSSLTSVALDAAIARGGCPFQHATRCTVHPLRPLGCRVYFCDPTAQAWQHEIYEALLRSLRSLHDRHTIPYEYAEWRCLLARFLRPQAARP